MKKNFCQQIIGTWEKFLANERFAFLMEPCFLLNAYGYHSSQLNSKGSVVKCWSRANHSNGVHLREAKEVVQGGFFDWSALKMTKYEEKLNTLLGKALWDKINVPICCRGPK